ncbi:MAG: hypothetical protein D6679_02805 [Candidatus Hydrogenedentota bacterium]|nr:MAG: hypothetical protein D6679_02805 [Candidatus Hydrogenedentota bacterium]
MAREDRFAAFAILKGFDNLPLTNPTVTIRKFRQTTAAAVAKGFVNQNIVPKVEPGSTSFFTRIGRRFDRKA